MSDSIMILTDANGASPVPAIRMRIGSFYRVSDCNDKSFVDALACRTADNWVCLWSLSNSRRNFITSHITTCDNFNMVFVETSQVFLDK